jgi:thiol-disulfide isomerase/thioredoxin
MDRLQAIAFVAAVLAPACDKGGGSEPPPSRVNAVKARSGQASTAGFCDVIHPAEKAPAFQLPALAAPVPAPPAGWRWLNVWATWCKPCIEEMPRLRQWRERLSSAARPVDLAFLSVDESDQVVASFRAAHPETPDSARIADTGALPAWMRSIGLDEGAPIPVHVFVDPAGRIRCVRAGGVAEDQYSIVKELFSE